MRPHNSIFERAVAVTVRCVHHPGCSIAAHPAPPSLPLRSLVNLIHAINTPECTRCHRCFCQAGPARSRSPRLVRPSGAASTTAPAPPAVDGWSDASQRVAALEAALNDARVETVRLLESGAALESQLATERLARVRSEADAAKARASGLFDGPASQQLAAAVDAIAAAKSETAEVLVQEAQRRSHITLTLTRTRTLLAEALEELQRSRSKRSRSGGALRGRASLPAGTTAGSSTGGAAAAANRGAAVDSCGVESKHSGEEDGDGGAFATSGPVAAGPPVPPLSKDERHQLVALRRSEVRYPPCIRGACAGGGLLRSQWAIPR